MATYYPAGTDGREPLWFREDDRADRTRTLNEIMEFDHVVKVHADGRITDGYSRPWAPDSRDGELDCPYGEAWDYFSTGYTGQDRATGPNMHDSESIGGRLARDIAENPGYYVALVDHVSPEGEDMDDPDYDSTAGWVVAFLPGRG
jgi:hypothetical protein